MKKIICTLLSAIIVLSAFTVVPVIASGAEVGDASGAGQVVKFDAKQWGDSVKTVFCHIWVRGGDSFWGWQAKAEICKKESGTVWAYDLSKLDSSPYVEGGLKSGVDYCVIFCANTGAQTYDMTFGTECIGDTAYMTDEHIENAMDSEKKAYEAVWTTNSSKYGPHLAISSIGNIIGSVLCPHESGVEVIGDWLPMYYDSPNIKSITNVVTAVLKKFGVNNIDGVYNYITSKDNDGNLREMRQILEDALAKAYPKKKAVISAESYTKTLGAKPFSLNAKTSGDGKLSYTSDNKKIATVSSKGKVTVKGVGTAHIFIKSAETDEYFSATEKITIKVKFGELKSVLAKSGKKGSVTVTHTSVKGAEGYNLKLSSNGAFFEKTVKSKGSFKLSGLTAGKWTMKIRPYTKAGGKKTVGKWKTVKFKVN